LQAYFTLVMATLTWIKGRKMALSPRARLALHAVLALAWAQASVGIITLLSHVPVSLASIHQNGALLLASSVIWLANEIRRIPK
jgi:cytochrome c oxidase assembly protein subunit 15